MANCGALRKETIILDSTGEGVNEGNILLSHVHNDDDDDGLNFA